MERFHKSIKVSNNDCTYIIKLLLEHYGIDPEIHYVNFPDEESEESSESSSEEEDAGNLDEEEEEDDENRDEEEDSSEEEVTTTEFPPTALKETYIWRKELKG